MSRVPEEGWTSNGAGTSQWNSAGVSLQVWLDITCTEKWSVVAVQYTYKYEDVMCILFK